MFTSKNSYFRFKHLKYRKIHKNSATTRLKRKYCNVLATSKVLNMLEHSPNMKYHTSNIRIRASDSVFKCTGINC